MASRNCLMRLKTFQLSSFNPPNGIAFSRGFCVSPPPVFKTKWLQAVSHAEKVVGNPTFLSLESLTSHEISNMAVYLKNLIETGHPLTSTVKELLNSKAKNDLTRGLLVLLVSKAGKHKMNEDILPTQRKLAEITEQIHTAHIIHSGILNLPTPNENLEMGNKMAILCGDFIQSRSSIRLAELKNIKIIELFGQAIADFSAVEFIDEDTYSALDLWTQQTKMRYGTLLSNACQSTLILGGNMDLLESAKNFGLEIAFAWQANIDLQSYKSTTKKAEHILTKLFPPGTTFEEILLIFEAVRDKHINASLKILAKFPQNDATLALCDIAKALKY